MERDFGLKERVYPHRLWFRGDTEKCRFRVIFLK